MAGPGKKGKAPLRPRRESIAKAGALQSAANTSTQQAVAVEGTVPTNTSNVNAVGLPTRSSWIRLFDEPEVLEASHGIENGTKSANVQADGRETATKTSANVRTSPTLDGMQPEGTPSSQNVGSNQSIGYETCETGNSGDFDSNGNDQLNAKRKRGLTRNIALSNVKKAGQKVHVQISEMSGRLIGEGAQRYISEASCMIRKYGKWKAPKWSRLSKEEREQMLKITNNSFMYDEGDNVKQALVKQLNSQYRSRQYNFHMIFKTFKTKEKALSNCPQYVEQSDWNYLCDYFCSPEFKEAKKGRTVGPIELYDMTHFSRKKNAMVDDISDENSRKMKEMQLETQASGASRTDEDICLEVTGRVTRYVRGRGPSKASVIAQKIAEIEDCKKRAEQAEKRSAELEIQVQSQQQLMHMLEVQQTEMQNQQAEMQDLLKALRAELQSKKQGNGSSSDNI